MIIQFEPAIFAALTNTTRAAKLGQIQMRNRTTSCRCDQTVDQREYKMTNVPFSSMFLTELCNLNSTKMSDFYFYCFFVFFYIFQSYTFIQQQKTL